MRNAVSNFSLTYSTGRALLLGIAAFTLLPAGCVTYRFGSAAMFRTGIRTIHVPIVRNDTFRHDLGIRLTEAITNEIENRTPYKVTFDDGTLSGWLKPGQHRALAMCQLCTWLVPSF